ncbi:MAG TPA: hypothetical protein VFZ36_06220 [Vicinamibacterales bacterium]
MFARRWRVSWPLAAVLAIELLAFAPALSQPGVLRAPAAKASDGTGATYPWHVFWRDEVAAGRVPFWNPFVFAGMPAAGEPQMQTFYPANALWLTMPPELAFKLTLVLHVLLGSMLMYGLVRELGARQFGAAVSAVTFGLHAQLLVFSFAGWAQVVAPMAWAPGVLWMLVRSFRAGASPRRAIAVGGALLGVQILSGHPEWVRYTLLAGVTVLLLHRGGAALKRRAAAGAAILGLGVLVGGPQLFPTLEAAIRSSRAQQAMASGPNLHGAGLPAITLPTALVPRLFGPWDLDVSVDGFAHKALNARISFGESLIYVGLLPLGLALAAIARRRPGAGPWTAVALAGLLFALNDVTHLQCALDWLVPPDAVFRSPGRFAFMTNLALAVLAGLGAEQLELRQWRETRVLRIGGAVSAALAIGAAGILALRARILDVILERVTVPASLLPGGEGAATIANWALGEAAGQTAIAAGLLAVSAVAAVWFMRAPGTRRAIVVIGVIALDLGLAARPFLTSVVKVDDIYAADLALLAPLAEIPQARFFASSPAALASGPNVAVLARTRSLSGYDLFVLPEWERLWRAAATGDPAGLSAMGVTHLVTRAGGGWSLQALPEPRGRAWWTSRAELAASADAAAAALTAGGGVESVVLDGAPPAGWTPSAATGPDVRAQTRIRIDRDEPGRLHAGVAAPVDGWLVITEVFYPGWRARVNGEQTDIRRAFGALQAVRIPAGTSRIELEYRPRAVAWGAAAAAAGAILIVLVGRRPRRRVP